jgi:hypothetical protein
MSERAAAFARRLAAEDSVCVFVRRAEYLKLPLHGVMGAEYFRAAADVVRQRVRAPVFHVFSDDLDWCRDALPWMAPGTLVTHDLAGPKYGTYLQLMAACRHFIIANSTFGWWAAWLGGEPGATVVAPSRWFADATIATQDLIPSTWMRL